MFNVSGDKGTKKAVRRPNNYTYKSYVLFIWPQVVYVNQR